jgi:hypothetical protein
VGRVAPSSVPVTDAGARLSGALAGRYRLERELGQGGMATVYLAHDERHGRPVALKVLRAELAAVLGAERFLAEIKTTANLQHPHILPLFDSGSADGFLYYVMPYVEGESLRDRLTREQQLPVEDAVRIAAEVAEALEYAHQQGVIHRDIKPENILLYGSHALVADFGIALAVSRIGGTRLTETGLSVGTPAYMAPEQAMGERVITPRADVYALGCVLYEMLVGEPPFTGPTAQAVVAKVMTEKPAPPSAVRDTVPEQVEDAVVTALAKLPADRFESAAAFAAALRAPRAARATTTRAAWPALPAAGPWRRVSAVLGLVVIALGSVTAWALTRGRGGPAPAVFDAALPDSARMDFTGQTVSTPYGSPLRNLTLSADGSFVVYLVRRGETTTLWRRSLLDGSAAPIPGTDGASTPRLSPDGSQLAFVAGTSVMIEPMAGGQPSRIADFDGQVSTLEWVSTTRLLLVDIDGFRFRWVGAEGGASGTRSIPRCIDGQWIAAEQRLLCSLGGVGRVIDAATGAAWTVRTRAAGGAAARPVPGSAFRVVGGKYLVYASPEGDLRAAPYDRRTHEIGRAVTVLTGVRLQAEGTSEFDVNASGTLIYAPGSNAGIGRVVRLTRGGTPAPLPVEPGPYQRWDLSHDGRWLATVSQGPGYQELRVHDLRDRQSFVWLRAGFIGQPLWSPDGSWMIVVAGDSSGGAILRGSPFSSGGPDTVVANATPADVPGPMDVHSAHEAVAITVYPPRVVAFDPLSRPVRFDTIARDRVFVMTSPDGRHMVFGLEAGSRVLMTSAPPGAWERQIASNAVEPIWLSSAEILYRSGVTWYLVRIDPATGQVVGGATVWGRDLRFSDTFGWSNRPDWHGGIIYLQGPEDTDARYLRIIPEWVEQMRAAVDRANR